MRPSADKNPVMHPLPLHALCSLSLISVGAVSIAGAQTMTPAQSLQPVDATYADVNPLRTSTRVLRPDLRSPTGFDRVYRVPGSTRGISVPGTIASGQPKFERISGALSAVFSASEYTKDEDGHILPVTPTGTVYYIGGVPRSAPAPAVPLRISPLAATSRVSQYIDTLDERNVTPGRAAIRADFAFDQDAVAQPTVSPTITYPPKAAPATTHTPTMPPSDLTSEPRRSGRMLSDDAFRRARIRTLLLSAADAAASS